MRSRRHRSKYIFVAVLLLVLSFVAIIIGSIARDRKATYSSENGEDGLTIVTSFYPMYIATLNIVDGVDGITLKNLSEPQTGCLHDYQLTPEDMILLSTADVFIINGGGIEEFLMDVVEAYPDLIIIDTSEDVELLGDNTHIWMSVPRYESQVNTIARSLSEIDVSNEDAYLSNLAKYDEKLQSLIERSLNISSLIEDTRVISFHEAYEYLADDFSLEITYTMDLDEERSVSAGEVAEVIDEIVQDNISVILAEETNGSKMAGMVQEETDVNVIYLDTLVRSNDMEYDKDSYVDVMNHNYDLIEGIYKR